jgi:hypothetical protein
LLLDVDDVGAFVFCCCADDDGAVELCPAFVCCAVSTVAPSLSPALALVLPSRHDDDDEDPQLSLRRNSLTSISLATLFSLSKEMARCNAWHASLEWPPWAM